KSDHGVYVQPVLCECADSCAGPGPHPSCPALSVSLDGVLRLSRWESLRAVRHMRTRNLSPSPAGSRTRAPPTTGLRPLHFSVGPAAPARTEHGGGGGKVVPGFGEWRGLGRGTETPWWLWEHASQTGSRSPVAFRSSRPGSAGNGPAGLSQEGSLRLRRTALPPPLLAVSPRPFCWEVARHVSAMPWGLSASAALRPAASRRPCLTNVLWSGSNQAKFAFSTSSSHHTPAVTEHAPYFKGTAVVKGEFKELSLDDFKGKYLVLFFYPLDFTFVCPTEIVAFSDKANEFHDVNCDVVAVSVDSHFCHLAWINTPRKNGGLGHMNITLLSDLTKQISRDYGVLLEGSGVALRGLFIIDPNGVIKHLSINDLPVGRSVEETLRLVKAFQFVESHGEVCPANWTPDSPTVDTRSLEEKSLHPDNSRLIPVAFRPAGELTLAFRWSSPAFLSAHGESAVAVMKRVEGEALTRSRSCPRVVISSTHPCLPRQAPRLLEAAWCHRSPHVVGSPLCSSSTLALVLPLAALQERDVWETLGPADAPSSQLVQSTSTVPCVHALLSHPSFWGAVSLLPHTQTFFANVFLSLLSTRNLKSMILPQASFYSYSTVFNMVNGNASYNRRPLESILLGTGVIASSTFFGVAPRLLLKAPLDSALWRKALPVLLIAHISGMNVIASRGMEPMRGIEVMDKDGNVIGYSRKAGTKAVRDTAISRVLLFGTSALIPEVVSFFFKRGRQRPPLRLGGQRGGGSESQIFQLHSWSLWTLKLSCTVLVMGLMVPVSFSVFPQIGRIQCSQLEKEIQSATEEMELFYNRGGFLLENTAGSGNPRGACSSTSQAVARLVGSGGRRNDAVQADPRPMQ
ncbi:LOW QUALITY PROTEIN: Thioredoxin-dependent peroxide reductase, mitochondrial, partial [Galemys pyrenaicus]